MNSGVSDNTVPVPPINPVPVYSESPHDRPYSGTPNPAMRHDVNPQTSTLTSSQLRPEAPQTKQEWGNPRAEDILKKLKKADNPLDFIKNNLAPKGSDINPQAILDIHSRQPATPLASALVPQSQVIEPSPLVPPPVDAVKEPLPQQAVPPADPVAAQSSDAVPAAAQAVDAAASLSDDADAPIDPKDPAASIKTSYKNLLKKHKENSELLKAIDTERTQLRQKLESYESGDATPEAIQKLQSRIQELEPLEALVNLKKSPVYKTKFVEPLNKINDKLHQIAKDYEIPPEVLQQASQYTNRADLNRFLLNHFDEVGALEVKQLITEAQTIQSQAKTAEQEPARMLESLQREHEQAIQQQVAQRRTAIADRSERAWSKAVMDIRTAGRVKELMPRENDPVHNDTWVKPIMERAASEYGAIVRTLAEHGLEDLPEDVAVALANASLLSIASAVSIERANAAERHAAELEKNTSRTNGMLRPSMGSMGQGVSSTAPSSTAPDSPLSAGRAIINRVLSAGR